MEERQVSDRVFETGPGVYRISVPTPFAVGDANVYVLDGPRLAVIDSGVKQNSDQIRAALVAIGRTISDVEAIFLTHSHVDHAGAAALLSAHSGARVYLSPVGHRRLVDPAGRLNEDLPALAAFLAASGLSEETIANHRHYYGFFLRYGEPFPSPEPVSDGAWVEAAGHRLKVLATPGHSRDHVVYLDEESGVLFAGDHVLPHITANPIMERRDPGEGPTLVTYQESLRRVASLEVRLACPGHGRPFEDVAGRCREIIQHQTERCERVFELLRDRGSATRKDLAIALFGKRPLSEVFLTLSEVQAALEVLMEDGRVTVRKVNDVEHFCPA